MVIISKRVLQEFSQNHSNISEALNEWYQITKEADWNTLTDIKKSFNSVDYVGENRYVFNIKGNRYRLVALIFFSVRTVYIKFIGTHAEYNKIDVLTIDIK
jgi:mRNA interferase HigB